MSDAILEAIDLFKDYEQGGEVVHVLRGVSLSVSRGEILGIVGPSGAGKSTLLHLLGFLDRPTSGDVVLRGISLARSSPRRQAQVRNRHVGFVFQMYHLLPELTALENAAAPLLLQRSGFPWFPRFSAAKRKAGDLLERMGLGHRLEHRPNQLSGGEQQRVAIARALIADPDVLLCDEPTGNLDRATGDEIRELLVRLHRETGRTTVIVTHDEATLKIASRVLQLREGRLCEIQVGQK